EYLSALEMERKRSIILSLLSSLWQQDIVDLVPNKNNINNNYNRVLNVYELLRKHYPNLPYRLGIYKTLYVLRKLVP
ncbi:MAG: YkgJ family cysteine cluster protein, partial [Desulfurococcales archaeon]|nr:YkgJ family cysteine cluster protein [Desulfurococcales archaeon]